jgi:hypothetical protein
MAARLYVSLLVKVEVLRDKAARVFIVTSPNLKGLVVEVHDNVSKEQIQKEIHGCVEMLMQNLLSGAPKSRSITIG